MEIHIVDEGDETMLFTTRPPTDEELEEENRLLPRYGVPGRLMFRIEYVPHSVISPVRHRNRLDWQGIEIIDYDGDSSVYWLLEGGFADMQVAELVHVDQPGVYVMEGLVGYYYRGDGWTTDDDETWSFETLRYATPDEERNEQLSSSVDDDRPPATFGSI